MGLGRVVASLIFAALAVFSPKQRNGRTGQLRGEGDKETRLDQNATTPIWVPPTGLASDVPDHQDEHHRSSSNPGPGSPETPTWTTEQLEAFGSSEMQTCAKQIMHKYHCAEPGCTDQVSGYINYFMGIGCTMQKVQWLGMVLMLVFLVFVLWLLGDTADVFFCPVLETVVDVFSISPSVAGVTALSFGNGAPDVFASLSNTLSGNLDSGLAAILGAGIFVTTVVVGAVSLASVAQLDRRPFLRDVGSYIIATIYLLIAFVDRKVSIMEAVGFIIIYIVFACVVVFGRRIYQSWKRRRQESRRKMEAPLLDPEEEKVHRRGRAMSEDFVLSERESVRRDAMHFAAAGEEDGEEEEGAEGESRRGVGAGEEGKRDGGVVVGGGVDDVWSGRASRKGRDKLAKVSTALSMEKKKKSFRVGLKETGSVVGSGGSGEASERGGDEEMGALDKRSRRHSVDHGHLARVRSRHYGGEVSRSQLAHDKVNAAISTIISNYHAPPTMLDAHTRRTKHIIEALEMESGSVRRAGLEGNLQVGVGDVDKDGKDGNEDEGESTGVLGCLIKYFGEGSTFGLVLDWILWPSTFVRQISSPLLGDEDYDWRFVTITPFFGFPLVITTAYDSVADDGVAGSFQPIGGQVWLNALSISVFCGLICSIALFYVLPRDEPPKGWLIYILILYGFLTSVSWITVTANEAVSLLQALGIMIHVPGSVLNLTIMAWGNSIGDLVADVTVARNGLPKMGLAAAYAGPLFNLLMGLGLSLTVGCLKQPDHVIDLTNPSGTPLSTAAISVTWLSFGFLLASLVSSIIVVPIDGFRVRPWWGICLMVLYVIFLGLSLYFTFRKQE